MRLPPNAELDRVDPDPGDKQGKMRPPEQELDRLLREAWGARKPRSAPTEPDDAQPSLPFESD
jgi:hypothetical protein